MVSENLVSIETQTERSLTNRKSETQIFLKMYVSAVKHGLLADMGDANWRTLCVIASYMGEDGIAYPTQDLIAKNLGITRQAANKRVRKLLEYKWEGRPVIVSKRERSEGGSWENTVYKVLPLSQLGIFKKEAEPLTEQSSINHANSSHVV